MNYASYGYHTEKEFQSQVSWKGALEAFAEGYHFPFVHGERDRAEHPAQHRGLRRVWQAPPHRLSFNWVANLADDPTGSWDPHQNMGVIYWIYPNLILANSPVGVEIIDILPAGEPTRCSVRHSWMGRVPTTDDAMRAVYDQVYDNVHAAVVDEDFAMLP